MNELFVDRITQLTNATIWIVFRFKAKKILCIVVKKVFYDYIIALLQDITNR